MIDDAQSALKSHVVDHLDQISTFCGVDVFLLGPKFASSAEGQNNNGDAGRDQRWRVAIYGDMESAEHAKTRVLIFIDRLVSNEMHIIQLMGSNGNIAWTSCRWNYARALPSHSRMRTITKEYQAYRVDHKHGYLFPTTLLAGLQILPGWSTEEKPRGNFHHRRKLDEHCGCQAEDPRIGQPNENLHEGCRGVCG